MANEQAPEGKIWKCMACGKTSFDLYGNRAVSYGWDESCVLNARLVDDVQPAPSPLDSNRLP